MISDEKRKIDAAELAKALLDEFIQRDAFDFPNSLGLDMSTAARFNDKSRWYLLASTLIALGREEQANPRFSAVRAELERLYFPPGYEEGAPLVAAIKNAMKDLAGLQTPTEMTWARNWLLDIGVDEMNPAKLTRVALHFLDVHIIVSKTLRALEPI